MIIVPSPASNEAAFRTFWSAALDYQASKQSQLWLAYPEERIRNEIQAGLHFSIYSFGEILAGYFSIALRDESIWGEKERGDAIYIHRICVNPEQRGGNLTAHILSWAYGYAVGMGRKYIRMDTWADNQRLVEYYISCGFRRVGSRQLGVVPELPPHYNNIRLALFENAIQQPASCISE
jgi:ribosomal protein S18 acetylase RimI-like enzyme